MYSFPIVGGHHFDSVPGTTVEKRSIGSFADTLLATDTEIRIDFDAPKGRMILVGDPEHAGFNWAILNAGR